MATVAQKLLTAQEYARLPDDGRPTELVRGRIVLLNMPFPRHGEVCAQASYLLRRYLEDHPVGRVIGNDSGVITERDPDTVRGPDVAFYSFERVPRGPTPHDTYLPAAPELVLEVRSPSDRWMEIHAKAAEYLQAGVKLVCVLDPLTASAHVYSANAAAQTFSADQLIAFPEVFQDFQVPVRRFFE
jgi:Uma2 family endonuclease